MTYFFFFTQKIDVKAALNSIFKIIYHAYEIFERECSELNTHYI